MSSYAGNSPGKNFARSWAYGQIDPKKLRTMLHIDIASRECGDIHYLLAMGVPKHLIIACDPDRLALTAALTLGVRTLYTDIVEAVSDCVSKGLGSQIASVNIDLCMTLQKGAPILTEVLKLLEPLQVQVFFTYLRGRDNMSSDKERHNYLVEKTGISNIKEHNYQSSVEGVTKGSPMCMARIST